MSGRTSIEWCWPPGYEGDVWNPTTGCTRVSAGCDNCYAFALHDKRHASNRAAALTFFSSNDAGMHSGDMRTIASEARSQGAALSWPKQYDLPFSRVQLLPDRLDAPLRKRKPTCYFVDSMADLFHEDVPDEFIDRVFAAMARAPQHRFLILTKRPERMRTYCSDPGVAGRIERLRRASDPGSLDAEELREILGYPGYLASSHGHIYSTFGRDACAQCGEPIVGGTARKRYCSKKCHDLAHYHRKANGRATPAGTRRMSPDEGEQGHLRVTLRRDGQPVRELVHRLILTAFVRPPRDGEQGCHEDGNPLNNAIGNLRWGTQEDNWEDRKRHLATRSYPWPLANVFLGTSVEDQRSADERIPHLLATPAAVRFLSCEPLLGPVDLTAHLSHPKHCGGTYEGRGEIDGHWAAVCTNHDRRLVRCVAPWPAHAAYEYVDRIDWVIVGGESGPRARPMDLAWARSLRDQCAAAGVSFFMKQLGSKPLIDGVWSTGAGGAVRETRRISLRESHGRNMSEWPLDLRVRTWPR